MTPDRCEYGCSCARCISLELHCDDCNDRQYDDSIERLLTFIEKYYWDPKGDATLRELVGNIRRQQDVNK